MRDEAEVSHICQMNGETIQINQTGSCSLASDYPEQTKLGCHVYVSQPVRMKFPPSPANLQSSHTCGGPLLQLCYNFFALVCYSSPSLWRYAWYCIGRRSLTIAKYFAVQVHLIPMHSLHVERMRLKFHQY